FFQLRPRSREHTPTASLKQHPLAKKYLYDVQVKLHGTTTGYLLIYIVTKQPLDQRYVSFSRQWRNEDFNPLLLHILQPVFFVDNTRFSIYFVLAVDDSVERNGPWRSLHGYRKRKNIIAVILQFHNPQRCRMGCVIIEKYRSILFSHFQ